MGCSATHTRLSGRGGSAFSWDRCGLCPPLDGAIVEIGSYKGKSTVMLAKVAAHYGLGRIIAIDPHNFNNPELLEQRTRPDVTSFDEFVRNICNAGVADQVEPHRDYSTVVAQSWNLPIRFLWIDGDHTYMGAKSDFDGFSRHLLPRGIVALHDALHPFSGPIRVFVEEVLGSDDFGPAQGSCGLLPGRSLGPRMVGASEVAVRGSKLSLRAFSLS